MNVVFVAMSFAIVAQQEDVNAVLNVVLTANVAFRATALTAFAKNADAVRINKRANSIVNPVVAWNAIPRRHSI